MRRRLLFVMVGVLMIAAAVPASSSAQAPTANSVAGAASEIVNLPECATIPIATCLENRISVDAHSEASGASATGTLDLGFSLGSRGATFIDADVTCLSVSGKVAIIGALGDHAGPMELDFYRVAVVVRVVDGGGPASGLDAWEVLASEGDAFAPPPSAPTNCPAFLAQPAGPLVNVNQEGDLTVIGASPTSKDQCKNGGWRTFPGFRSQGQCVSFVATGGRNQPAVP